MGDTNSVVLRTWLTSVIRAALVFAGAWLVRKGWVSEDQTKAVIENNLELIVGAVLTLAALGWAWFKAKAQVTKEGALLKADPSMTRAEFEARHTSVTERVTGEKTGLSNRPDPTDDESCEFGDDCDDEDEEVTHGKVER